MLCCAYVISGIDVKGKCLGYGFFFYEIAIPPCRSGLRFFVSRKIRAPYLSDQKGVIGLLNVAPTDMILFKCEIYRICMHSE